MVRDTPITLPQMHTLEILGQQSPLRMKELAAKMGVTTGTLTVNVDRLEKQGLVARIPHETDRRSIRVGLTPEGGRLYSGKLTCAAVKGLVLLLCFGSPCETNALSC